MLHSSHDLSRPFGQVTHLFGEDSLHAADRVRMEQRMPRIPPKALRTVCYLYETAEGANKGTEFGGTAFLVHMPAAVPNRSFIYAVTNWHVAVRGGASNLRLNNTSGDTDVFLAGPEQWHFDPRYDIAVLGVPLDNSKQVYSLLPAPAAFVTKEDVEREQLGPGEDVFMVGRFVDHDGGAINRPAVRFGNISVMPSPIEQPNGKVAEAYCIDLHSRSGYSGSPVFVYRTPGYDLEKYAPESIEEAEILTAGAQYLGLLGIHFAQFPEDWEIGHPPSKPAEGSVPLIREGAYVRGLSGMTCVLPAWCILDVLNSPKLQAQRDEVNEKLRKEFKSAGKMPPTAE